MQILVLLGKKSRRRNVIAGGALEIWDKPHFYNDYMTFMAQKKLEIEWLFIPKIFVIELSATATKQDANRSIVAL